MRIFYAQSGGVTSVINTTLASLIKKAREKNDEVLIGINGIKGALEGKFFNTEYLSEEDINLIKETPGGSFGSCRYKLKEEDLPVIDNFFSANKIDAFVYHGGNDSQDTTLKISKYLSAKGRDILCLGLPKTIDNDLNGTDISPGFSSSARFLNLALRQTCLDVRSMCNDSTKVFIIETMGRHTGWLAASCGVAHTPNFPGPHLLLIPEIKHDSFKIIEKIKENVKIFGFCAIAISEGYQPDLSNKDSFGHGQLSNSGQKLYSLVKENLGFKTHLAIPDYLQRSFYTQASDLDKKISTQIAEKAIENLHHGVSDKMIAIKINQYSPLIYEILTINLDDVANKEKFVPRDYLDEEGFHLSPKGRDYFEALLRQENGMIFPKFWPHFLNQKTIAETPQLPHHAQFLDL